MEGCCLVESADIGSERKEHLTLADMGLISR